MVLKPGARIGPYEVVAPLGRGGMGEVHRARDPQLRREVALKTLPDTLSSRPDHLARLRREARALASLSHPGIATLHGIEESDGAPVLVMELLPGETLAQRLRRGPLPLKEVLQVGRQVAEAMAAAEEKGILHRDLKPSNIQLTGDSRIKVLDFGLACRLEGSPADAALSTEASLDRPGSVLGSAPYMSPEQARGADVDARTDVWAFGCVLFEMLTGKRAFPGGTFAETAAGLLHDEPDWTAIPASTPTQLLRLLRRCLRKQPAERLHTLADAALELRELEQDLGSGERSIGRPGSASRRLRVRWIGVGAAVAVLLTLALAGYRWRSFPPRGSHQLRLEATLPRGVALPRLGSAAAPIAVSPDGAQVVFAGSDASSCRLFLRNLRELEAQPLPGTEGASDPFFSPDGEWIAFAADGKLKKIRTGGGSITVLADAAGLRGGSWGKDGTILFNRGGGGLLRISAAGGEVHAVTKPDAARGEGSHRWPRHLPGGWAALFDIVHTDVTHEVAVLDLRTGKTHVLVDQAAFPRYAPTGHLLFGRQGVVYAAPLDVQRLALTGPPRPVLEGVAMWDSPGGTGSGAGNAYYDVSAEGTLVFSPREARLPQRTLSWADRLGRLTPLSSELRAWAYPHLSRDGRRLAVTAFGDDGAEEVFLLDIQREAWTKLPIPPLGAGFTGSVSAWSWMPDGHHLLVLASFEGAKHLLLVADDGLAPPKTLHAGWDGLPEPTPDGSLVLFCVIPTEGPQWDIYHVPLSDRPVPAPWLATPAWEVEPSFSPDGRWVAYRSDASGDMQVYVRPYPGPGPSHMVSVRGGLMPLWSHDGREVFFTDGRALLSARVHTSSTFASETPRKLFDLPEDVPFGFDFYDVTPDGQRFVVVRRDPIETRPFGLVVVSGWTRELIASGP